MLNHLLENLKGTVFHYRKNVVFYLLLVALMFTLLRPGVNVPFVIRIGLMFLALFPTLSHPEYLPFCMTCIVGISSNAFYQIMPHDPNVYLVIVLLLYINYRRRSGFFLNAFGIYFVFLLFSVVHGDVPVFLTWGLIAVILADFVKSKTDIGNLMMAFMIASTILSLLFLIYQGQFTVDYGSGDDKLERAYWINANRFGAVIAAGGVMAAAYLTGLIQTVRRRLLTVLSVATVVLAIPTLILNASRGAAIAFVVPSLLMFALSKKKYTTKLAILATVVFLLYFLYVNTSLFELLIMRMNEGDLDTANGRTNIWMAKLGEFVELDAASQFVGIGRSACVRLAGFWSTHNDFLTALIGYGYFGLVLFSLLIAFPFIKAPRRSKKAVLILTIYIVIECCVLEPIFRGYLFFLMFYIFTIRYALIDRKEYKKEILAHRSKQNK